MRPILPPNKSVSLTLYKVIADSIFLFSSQYKILIFDSHFFFTNLREEVKNGGLNLKNWVISYSLILFLKDIYLFPTTVPVKFFNWNILILIFQRYLLKSSFLISNILPVSNFSKSSLINFSTKIHQLNLVTFLSNFLKEYLLVTFYPFAILKPTLAN